MNNRRQSFDADKTQDDHQVNWSFPLMKMAAIKVRAAACLRMCRRSRHTTCPLSRLICCVACACVPIARCAHQKLSDCRWLVGQCSWGGEAPLHWGLPFLPFLPFFPAYRAPTCTVLRAQV